MSGTAIKNNMVTRWQTMHSTCSGWGKEVVRLCESFDSARRINHHFFGSKANFEDAHATSRATTEQTTRLKFGWLRCPKPSSTTRLETPVSQTSPVVLADLVLYLIWVVDKITCWPKWVVPYLWEFVLQCYVYLYGIGKWVVPYRLWRFSHKFEHSKSTPYHFHLVLILSLTHFIWCWYIALALRSQPWICLFWIVIACRHTMQKHRKNWMASFWSGILMPQPPFP